MYPKSWYNIVDTWRKDKKVLPLKEVKDAYDEMWQYFQGDINVYDAYDMVHPHDEYTTHLGFAGLLNILRETCKSLLVKDILEVLKSCKKSDVIRFVEYPHNHHKNKYSHLIGGTVQGLSSLYMTWWVDEDHYPKLKHPMKTVGETLKMHENIDRQALDGGLTIFEVYPDGHGTNWYGGGGCGDGTYPLEIKPEKGFVTITRLGLFSKIRTTWEKVLKQHGERHRQREATAFNEENWRLRQRRIEEIRRSLPELYRIKGINDQYQAYDRSELVTIEVLERELQQLTRYQNRI